MTLASPVRETADIPALFTARGYAVVPRLIGLDEAAQLRAHLESRCANGSLRMAGDDLVPQTPSIYGDAQVDGLMESLRPRIEALTGLRLHPTYSYARLYKRGDTLTPHKDRDACEISISLNLGQQPDAPWALHIGKGKDALAAMLTPGDALLYRGIDHTHWRHPYEGVRMAQVFLHYVDQDGPHRGEKFDRRAALGDPLSPELAANALL